MLIFDELKLPQKSYLDQTVLLAFPDANSSTYYEIQHFKMP